MLSIQILWSIPPMRACSPSFYIVKSAFPVVLSASGTRMPRVDITSGQGSIQVHHSLCENYALYLFLSACITCKIGRSGCHVSVCVGYLLTGSCDSGSFRVGCACVLVHMTSIGGLRRRLQWLLGVVYILHNLKSNQTRERREEKRQEKGHCRKTCHLLKNYTTSWLGDGFIRKPKMWRNIFTVRYCPL